MQLSVIAISLCTAIVQATNIDGGEAKIVTYPWLLDDNLVVGHESIGSLLIESGGTVTNKKGIIGAEKGSEGNVEVSGANASWENKAVLMVGGEGKATLMIKNGAAVNNNDQETSSYIGWVDTADGAVTVTGKQSTWNNQGALYVGYYGQGQLTISEGGNVSNTHSNIGSVLDSYGKVEVNGANSHWENKGAMTVGYAGTATLMITNGGAVHSNAQGDSTYIGKNSKGKGAVTVTDTDSTWENKGALYVGHEGQGELIIRGGGDVSNTAATIGYQVGSEGNVEVSGAKSRWNNKDVLTVGLNGNKATLTINNGGAVHSHAQGDSTYIGKENRSKGAVTVTDTDSTWNNQAALYIGYQGQGHLTIAEHGTVSAGNTVYIGYRNTSSGTLNIGAAEGNAVRAAGKLTAPEVRFGGGEGKIVFNHTDIAYLFSADIVSGASSVSPVRQLSGTTILTGTHAYYGDTVVVEGALQAGKINAFSAHSQHSLQSNGRLNLDGYSQILLGLHNAGVVQLGSASSKNGVGTTLTVKHYVGNGGTLYLRTALGEDGSVSDKLVIDGGRATGTTKLGIINIGGAGAVTMGDGILVVETINDGTTAAEAFSLEGLVVAGDYKYQLYRGGADNSHNWYLRNTAYHAEEGGDVKNLAEDDKYPLLRSSADNPDNEYLPNTVHRAEEGGYVENLQTANRLFNLRLQDRTMQTEDSHGWIRLVNGVNRAEAGSGQLKTTTLHSMLQLGREVWAHTFNNHSRTSTGLMAGYGHARHKSRSTSTDYRATGKIDGYSVGLYGTWYQNGQTEEGAYVDSWLQYSAFKAQVGDQQAQEKYRIKGVSASLEGGYRIPLVRHAQGSYTLTPQIQVVWNHVQANDHIEKNGAHVRGHSHNMLQSRVGAQWAYTRLQGAHHLVNAYVEANWIYHNKFSSVSFDGVHIRQDGSRHIAEFTLGLEYEVSKQTRIWANAAHQSGAGGYRDLSATVGWKYCF